MSTNEQHAVGSLQLQFRFKALRSYSDIDPSRIEAVIRGLEHVEHYQVHDDRLSDATFVTLIITLRPADRTEITALLDTLRSFSSVRVFAVDPAGKLTPLEELSPEQVPDAARYAPTQ